MRKKLTISMKSKEALIKSDVQIALSNFSSEKCNSCVGILTDFKQFLSDMAENLQVSCTSKCMLQFIQRFPKETAAEYQIARNAKENNITQDEVRDTITKYMTGRFLSVFREKTVNVLTVNLMLYGILK